MGHCRLAILDVSDSRQPMHDPLNRYTLIYNGEVYNFRELRQPLTSHWNFRTRGDTEVVLAGLVHYGEAFLSKMEGMWALALWDRHKQTLLLSRDRLGQKPLFYEHSPRHFACASELPTLHALTQRPWQEDSHSTADYLRYGYYLPGTTAYTDIHEVLPGHVVHWSLEQGKRQHSYWSLSLGTFRGSKAQARELLREKLTQAVARRMVADVEVGAFLSGGIDSSLLVGIMAKELGLHPRTFTVGFADSTFDERPFARDIAQLWRTNHAEYCAPTHDAVFAQELLLDHVGQPFADVSLLPTADVSHFAARHLKVAVAGDGGDELFSGYQRYQARMILRWYSRLPRALRRHAEQYLQRLPEPMAHHSHSLLKKAHLFSAIVQNSTPALPYIAPMVYPHRMFTQLAPSLLDHGHPPPQLPEETQVDSLQTMMYTDAVIYLPQDILSKVDRASMAHSLEVRAPFLDREVVELAFALPCHWHRRAFRGKRMLNESFNDLLPRHIVKRRKQGFVVPVHHWFRHHLGNELVALLAAHPHSPLKQDFALSLLEEHREGQRDHSSRLWSIYIYLLWKERSACLHPC
jgi:asparagine synthase (glutamine-hydrolysing)